MAIDDNGTDWIESPFISTDSVGLKTRTSSFGSEKRVVEWDHEQETTNVSLGEMFICDVLKCRVAQAEKSHQVSKLTQ